MGVVSFHKDIIVCGGINDSTSRYQHSVERYSTKNDTWTLLSPMKYRRAFFTIVALEEYLYAIGGMNKYGCLHKVK